MPRYTCRHPVRVVFEFIFSSLGGLSSVGHKTLRSVKSKCTDETSELGTSSTRNNGTVVSFHLPQPTRHLYHQHPHAHVVPYYDTHTAFGHVLRGISTIPSTCQELKLNTPRFAHILAACCTVTDATSCMITIVSIREKKMWSKRERAREMSSVIAHALICDTNLCTSIIH